jgi:PAS domain S-box-containing protein
MTLRLSVRSKVLLSGVVIVLLISLFNAVYYPQRQKRAAMEAMRERARNTAGMLALSTGIGLELHQLEAVTAAFAWAKSDPSLAYIVVMDSGGTVFASYNPQHVEVVAPRALGPAVVQEEADRLVAVAPISTHGRDYGRLVLGLSLDGLRAQIARDRLTALVVSLATLAVGAALSLVLAGRIAAPIVLLRQAADQISRGQYDVTLPRGGDDEVGALSAAFRTMADTVRASIAQLAAQAGDLQERERQLSAAQARLHHVLASGNAIVYSVRVEGQTFIPEWVSDNLSRVMGYEVADALGATWWLDHLHPEDRHQALVRLSALFASDGFTHEYRFRHKDGQYRWLRDELHLVRDANGTPREAVGVWLDVTERKVAEENQQMLLHELQSALAEVKTLRGMIKICANCKRVLTDEGGWQQFESYVRGHSDVEFSHGMCPECALKWAAEAE